MPATGARRGHLVYHWKHGWIPLDHFAALSKAKGNRDLAKKYADRHGLPSHYPNQQEAEAALNRSLPKGYSVEYVRPRKFGGDPGFVVTRPDGTKSPSLPSGADVRSNVYAHRARANAPAAPVEPPPKKQWSLKEANRQFAANQAKEDAGVPRGTVTDSQVALIQKLLIQKARSGTGDGFMRGPKTRKGILGLSRTEASAYINSLRGDY